ncbi:hypothetical protein CGCSCA5_v006972 [Colletotrichum siamense]|nr:hypothetical protein CGCSCA5_v006972 [Colletotrichum siamense]
MSGKDIVKDRRAYRRT